MLPVGQESQTAFFHQSGGTSNQDHERLGDPIHVRDMVVGETVGPSISPSFVVVRHGEERIISGNCAGRHVVRRCTLTRRMGRESDSSTFSSSFSRMNEALRAGTPRRLLLIPT